MNNDELQKAIDDITKSDVEDTTEGASENDALVDELAQTSMPTTGEAPALSPAGDTVAAPEIAVPELKIPEVGAMPPIDGAVEPAAPAPEPVAPATRVETAPVAPEVSTTVPEAPVTEPASAEVNAPDTFIAPEAQADLEKIEQEALKELYPLLNIVSLSAEEKFDICMRVAETDKNAIKGALEAAKGFADEKAKAEALLKIIDKIK